MVDSMADEEVGSREPLQIVEDHPEALRGGINDPNSCQCGIQSFHYHKVPKY